MTTCAIVLHLGQPRGPERPAVPPAIELIASSITQPWQSIQVDPGRLDGRIDPRHTHFFVDREGKWSATQTWQAQSHLGAQGVVQIALQPSANTNRVTPAQWDTTQRLMAVLLKKCNIPNDRDHIDVNDTLALPALTARQVPAAARPSVGQINLSPSR